MHRPIRAAIVVSALCLGVATARAGDEGPAVLQGEFQALRAVLDAELEGSDYQRVSVGRFLRLPRDTRRPRGEALETLQASGLAVDERVVESFRQRNRTPLGLWGSKPELLGERSDPGVFFLENPRHIVAQYARMGSSDSGDRGLVYLELRAHHGAEKVTAVFRAVERTEEGWRVLPERAGFVRDEFRSKPIER
jgi:hypothetical protein